MATLNPTLTALITKLSQTHEELIRRKEQKKKQHSLERTLERLLLENIRRNEDEIAKLPPDAEPTIQLLEESIRRLSKPEEEPEEEPEGEPEENLYEKEEIQSGYDSTEERSHIDDFPQNL